uniref:Uncharacterized protein n=1 Tax=Gasterosteus aculeatus TaxID=69293 RepID=G3PUG0_GASAC
MKVLPANRHCSEVMLFHKDYIDQTSDVNAKCTKHCCPSYYPKRPTVKYYWTSSSSVKFTGDRTESSWIICNAWNVTVTQVNNLNINIRHTAYYLVVFSCSAMVLLNSFKMHVWIKVSLM